MDEIFEQKRKAALDKKWLELQDFYLTRYKTELQKRGLKLRLTRPVDETIESLYREMKRFKSFQFYHEQKIRDAGR